MSWNTPMCLQLMAGHKIVESMLNYAEMELNFALSEQFVDWEEMECSSSMYVESLKCVRLWWNTIPGIKSSLGKCLQQSMTSQTDEASTSKTRKMKYVANFLVKTLLLEDLSTNKDFDNNASMCLIPSPLETFVAKVINRIHPLKCHRLSIYQGLYPSISEALLSSATHLRKIDIFHVNLTNDFVMMMGDCCPNLEIIHFHHVFIWNCISIDALYGCFFKGTPKRTFKELEQTGCIDHLISFPNLRELSIGFTATNQMINFHQDLLIYYPKLERLWHEWRPNMFEDEYISFTRLVIFPLIKLDISIYLKTFIVNYEDMSSISAQQLSLIVRMMPRLESVYIDYSSSKCNIATSRMSGKKMCSLRETGLRKLHLNIPSSYTSTMNLMSPLLNEVGEKLQQFTLETNNSSNVINFSTLDSFLSKCPNLQCLKILASHRLLVNLATSTHATLPRLSSLKELWIHEEAPWSLSDTSGYRNGQPWVHLVNTLLKWFTNISLLSITVCKDTADLLKITTAAKCLHLFFRDSCEWSIPLKQLYQLLIRCPNLDILFLEELEGEDFWKICKYFEKTKLKINWGNLHDWPRT